MVAAQRRAGLVIDERPLALGAGLDVAAVTAQDHRRGAAAVDDKDGLVARGDIEAGERRGEAPGQQPAIAVAELTFALILALDRRIADNVADLRQAFHDAVDDYLATCARIGKTPEKSYSGKLMLRVDPRLHARLVRAAKLAGKSLNQFGEEALGRGLADA